MRLKVELTWWGGVLADKNDPGPPEPDYELIDADSGKSLTDCQLRTHEEVEAYIAAHYPGCERWVPPPAPAEEAAALGRILDLLEGDVELDRVVIRRMLIGKLYQSGYPEEIVAKIKTWIARLK